MPCKCGLHASPTPFAALEWAPGALLHKVELGGVIVPDGTPPNKFAAQRRKIVATIDATKIMQQFARRVALDVIHLWDAPPVVREYLETGNPKKRDAVQAAARAAVWSASLAAVWAAALDAGRDAAHDASWEAAWDTARAAARAAAWPAAWAKCADLFNEMVEAEFAAKTEKGKGI